MFLCSNTVDVCWVGNCWQCCKPLLPRTEPTWHERDSLYRIPWCWIAHKLQRLWHLHTGSQWTARWRIHDRSHHRQSPIRQRSHTTWQVSFIVQGGKNNYVCIVLILDMQGMVMTTNWLFEPLNVVHGCSWHSVVTVQLTSVCFSQNIRPVYLLLHSLWTVLKHTKCWCCPRSASLLTSMAVHHCTNN